MPCQVISRRPGTALTPADYRAGARAALLAMAVVGCGAASDAPAAAPVQLAAATPSAAASTGAAQAAATPVSSAGASSLGGVPLHVHADRTGVQTLLAVKVVEVVGRDVIRCQWNREQLLVRAGPETRFASLEPDGRLHFDGSRDFAAARIGPGDTLNLTVDWTEPATDGAYRVKAVTRL